MQINRLFETIYILLDKKTVTAKELADKFEVSSRTIYRDIELLSQSGIPVYTNKGKGGGISILDSFILDKSLISDREQSAIITALAAMSSLPDVEKTGIEKKLTSIFQKDTASWINVDFSSWNDFQGELFNSLKGAVIEKYAIDIEYVNSKGELSKRIVEPLQLWFKGKTWYLIAYCRKADDYRVFRLSRIRNVLVTTEQFDREMCNFDYGNDKTDLMKVTLEISREAEYRVYDEFNNVKKTKNGFLVTMEYPEDEWLYGYIMSFGNYAKVLEPPRIQEIIKKKIENTLKNYL